MGGDVGRGDVWPSRKPDHRSRPLRLPVISDLRIERERPLQTGGGVGNQKVDVERAQLGVLGRSAAREILHIKDRLLVGETSNAEHRLVGTDRGDGVAAGVVERD